MVADGLAFKRTLLPQAAAGVAGVELAVVVFFFLELLHKENKRLNKSE